MRRLQCHDAKVWLWVRPSSKIRLGMVVGLGDSRHCLHETVVTATTAASFTSRLTQSTHSSGAERPRTPPWSIRPISRVLPPLKFDGADRIGSWGGSTRGGSTVNLPISGRRPIPLPILLSHSSPVFCFLSPPIRSRYSTLCTQLCKHQFL